MFQVFCAPRRLPSQPRREQSLLNSWKSGWKLIFINTVGLITHRKLGFGTLSDRKCFNRWIQIDQKLVLDCRRYRFGATCPTITQFSRVRRFFHYYARINSANDLGWWMIVCQKRVEVLMIKASKSTFHFLLFWPITVDSCWCDDDITVFDDVKNLTKTICWLKNFWSIICYELKAFMVISEQTLNAGCKLPNSQ